VKVTATESGDGNTASAQVIVAAPPTATISSPANNSTFALNAVVPTNFFCTEGASGPGLATCTDSHGVLSPNPGALDTSVAGVHTYTVTAVSTDTFSGSTTITYTVDGPPVNCLARGAIQISGLQTRALTISGPGTWCIQNAMVTAPVSISGGANVLIQNSTINSTMTVRGGGAFAVCGSTVASALNVSGATGFVVIGDSTDDLCAPNIIRAQLTLQNNTRGVEVSQNTLSSPLVVNGSTGTGTFSEDQGAELEGNSSHSTISCATNAPLTNGGLLNTGFTARYGQCTGTF
jgi:hypothetical protein